MNKNLTSEQQNEAPKQAIPALPAQPILDALADHIAIVDESGTILAANRAWNQFGMENGLSGNAGSVGSNYFSACKSEEENAHEFPRGLQAVLSGETDLFEMEYPCDTKSEKLWFRARITCLPNGSSRYAMISHINITESHETKTALQERTLKLEEMARATNEARLAALNMMEDAILAKERLADTARFPAENDNPVFRISKDGILLYRNAACEKMEPSLQGAMEADPVPEEWNKICQEALSKTEPVETEMPVGRNFYAVSLVPVAERGYLNVYAKDITQRKRMAEAIEKQILALTQPVDTNQRIDFETLFNQEEIQRIQDEFSEATGVASIITHPDGTPITSPSNFTELCFDIIRQTEKGCANCIKSDAAIGRYNDEGPIIQQCLSCGLWDAGASIEVGGQHIANWLIGQVRDGCQTDDAMRTYAQEIGADEHKFMEAFHRVPVMSYERFQKVAAALYTLANQLSSSAFQNMQQARFIAEQKKAEQSLREISRIQSLILDNSTLGIALVEDRKLLWVNPRLCEMLLYSEEELRGHPTRILYGSDKQFQEIGKTAYRELGQGKRYDHTMEFQRKDGSRFWCRLIGSALDPSNPTEAGSLWMLEDISEIRETQNQLQLLSTAIEQSPETIVVTNEKGIIQYANPAFERVTGYRLDEAINQTPSILNSGMHPPEFYQDIWDTISSGQTWNGQIVNKNKQGSTYTEEASIAPVKDEAGNIVNYVAVKRDITDELVREVELQQAQKMEAIGQLAGGVAHDFNNILQGIQGFSELLQLTLPKDTIEYKNAGEIHKASTRAADLTRQLLTFSRKEARQTEELDLNTSVYNAEALLSVLLGESHELVLQLDDDPILIEGDEGQLSQVIMNLAVNARDAMSEGGRLTISTHRTLFSQQDAIYIPHARPGAFACLAITDTGSGIDADILKQIFDPFFTTKDVGCGTGLGLSVIYGIIKQCEGWIHVYSEPGLGSTFKIYLPLVSDQETSESDEPPLSIPLSKMRILFVENALEATHGAVDILSEVGCNIMAAKTAEEGLALFEQMNGQFDVLMSDMVLPDMSGSQLAGTVRKRDPSIHVVLFSGFNDYAERWPHLLETDYTLENKPFTEKQLIATIKSVSKQ